MNLTIGLDDLWTPKPTQARFLDAITTSPAFAIPAYIGAFGSGKSWAVCRAAIGLSLAHPGIKGLIGRFNYTELRDTTLITFFDLIRVIEDSVRDRLPAARRHEFEGIGTFRRDTGDYQWFNGALTMFRPLEDGHRRFKSLTLGYFGVDEASDVEADRAEPPTILTLQGRLRQLGTPCIGFMVSNPTPFDHWLYKWYGEGVTGRTGIGRQGWPVFRTTTSENVDNLPPGYEANLRKSFPDDYVRRYLEGEWGGIDEGAPVFPTFTPVTHVRPVEWMRRTHVQVGIDFGYNSPGVVWAQIEPVTHRLHVLRSWDPKNLDVYKLAQGIQARQGEWFPGGRFQYYCGHDGNTRKDTNPKSSAEILAGHGMMPHASYTSLERGFSTLRSLLNMRDDALPGLLIHPNNALLIEALHGGYRYDPHKVDEPIKTGRYDPLVDALRYIAVSCFTTAGTRPSYTPMPAFQGLGART